MDTLYFGGGTPSRLGIDGVASMLAVVRGSLSLADDAEVTLEANPEDVTLEAVDAWRRAGVNRLSIGAQSFDDRVLRWMHRTHDAAAITRAAAAAQRGGINNFSIDLIFALPEGIERSWVADVQSALELRPAHLSLYGLTVEAHTPLARWKARGDVTESPDERYEDEFLHAHSALTSAGFQHYEVSNFGRPGGHSRHNANYWTGRNYAGLGPSAHEFDGLARRWNAPAYSDWLRRVTQGLDPVEGSETLSPANLSAEAVYLGLRTSEGLIISPGEADRIRPWIARGWANIVEGNRLVLTAQGWLRLDALAVDLTHHRSHY